MAHPFDRLIVQVAVCHLERRRQRRFVDGEPVILRGYLHAAVIEIQDRLIRAAMAELELKVLLPQASDKS